MNIILKGQLAFMQQHFEVIGVTGYDKKHFTEVKEREGIRMHAVEMQRNIAPLADFVSLWKLYRFFRKEKPDIVHTHTPKAGLLGMLAARLAGVPVRLHTVAGMPLMGVQGAKRKLLAGIERLVYACAHYVYPNSNGLKDFIIEQNFCDPKKLKVIANGASNGVNVNIYRPDFQENTVAENLQLRKNLGIEKDDLVLGFVGRIAQDKGIRELYAAFTALKNETDRSLKLLIIGPFEKHYGLLGGGLETVLENDPDVLLPGRFDDVRPFYSVFDIFVFPSYREGFPNVVMEAGAMGLPCVVTDINGCNEIISDGENGLIVPVKDSTALKNAVAQLIKNPQLRQSMRAAARPRILNLFRREIIWNGLLEEYKERLKSHR